MEQLNKNYTVFLSVETQSKNEGECIAGTTVSIRDAAIYLLDKSLPCKAIPCDCFYKGNMEPSIGVQVPSLDTVVYLLKFAKDHQQESILVIDYKDSAFLFYTDGRIVSMGTAYATVGLPKYVTETVAYTYIPSLDKSIYTL